MRHIWQHGEGQQPWVRTATLTVCPVPLGRFTYQRKCSRTHEKIYTNTHLLRIQNTYFNTKKGSLTHSCPQLLVIVFWVDVEAEMGFSGFHKFCTCHLLHQRNSGLHIILLFNFPQLLNFQESFRSRLTFSTQHDTIEWLIHYQSS